MPLPRRRWPNRRARGSRLEAVGIATDFVPGVSEREVPREGDALRIGLDAGLSALVISKRSAASKPCSTTSPTTTNSAGVSSASGKRVELSGATVVTFLPAYTLRQFFRHQLRWSRTIRDARRWGYAGLVFTFGLPWAIATLLISGGAAWAWAVLALTFAARLAVAVVAAAVVLDDRQALRSIVLLPLRDLIAPLVWAVSFLGNRIHWRGDVFDVKNGRLKIVKPG